MIRRTENLSIQEKNELVRLLATHTHETEIAKWMAEIGKPSQDLGQLLNHYRRSDKYRPMMEKIRAQYEAGLADIAISSKRYRLHEYQKIFEALKNEGKLEAAAKMLERVQGEMESKLVDSRTNIYITQFNQLSERELEERKLVVMQKLERFKKAQKMELEDGGYEKLRAENQIEAEVIVEADESHA